MFMCTTGQCYKAMYAPELFSAEPCLVTHTTAGVPLTHVAYLLCLVSIYFSKGLLTDYSQLQTYAELAPPFAEQVTCAHLQ